MAKQRRNRERATELMSTLDELVPAVYPYRAFTSTNGEESSLRKRSRNKTLEDVISCVSRAMAHAERESRKLLNTNIDMEDLFASEYASIGIAILQDNGEVISASDSLSRILAKPKGSLVGCRIFIATGGWNQNKDGSVTCETSPANVILGHIKNRGPTVQDAAHDPRPKAYRTLIVHEHMMQCSPYGPLAELERKEKKRRASVRGDRGGDGDESDFMYSEHGSTMGSIQMRMASVKAEQMGSMHGPKSMNMRDFHAPTNTPMQSINQSSDSMGRGGGRYRSLFSSMLDSRELRGMDDLARQLAVAKAEQAFVQELERLERHKLMDYDGPQSMSAVEFSMHRQRMEQMHHGQAASHNGPPGPGHELMFFRGTAPRDDYMAPPRSMQARMGGGGGGMGGGGMGGGGMHMMEDQAAQFKSVQIRPGGGMMAGMQLAGGQMWGDLGGVRGGWDEGIYGGGQRGGGSSYGGGGHSKGPQYMQGGHEGDRGQMPQYGGRFAAQQHLHGHGQNMGMNYSASMGGGGSGAGTGRSLGSWNQGGDGLYGHQQNAWQDEQASQMRAVRVNIGEILKMQNGGGSTNGEAIEALDDGSACSEGGGRQHSVDGGEEGMDNCQLGLDPGIIFT